MIITKSDQAPIIHIKELIITCNSHMRSKAGTRDAEQNWLVFPHGHILLIQLQCQAYGLAVMWHSEEITAWQHLKYSHINKNKQNCALFKREANQQHTESKQFVFPQHQPCSHCCWDHWASLLHISPWARAVSSPGGHYFTSSAENQPRACSQQAVCSQAAGPDCYNTQLDSQHLLNSCLESLWMPHP